MIIEYCKLQIGSLLIVLYLGFVYMREDAHNRRNHRWSLFDLLLVLSICCLIFDGITAYTVNRLDSVPAALNRAFHMLFFLSIDSFIFVLFLYMLTITEGMPAKWRWRCIIYAPFLLNVLLVVLSMDSLYYCHGKITDYSMGLAAYTCYTMAGIYVLLTILTFFWRWNYIERHKRASIVLNLLIMGGVSAYQMMMPEALLSSLGVTMIVIGVYLNLEAPALRSLASYHQEMVMGMETLLESRDGNTGAHIRRTSIYVELLAKELRKRGCYRNILTKDYIDMLRAAAPMHDIGKVAVPDAVLQKKGKLSTEEFEIMKKHTVDGGHLIQEVFLHLDNEEFMEIAYQVARHHHEKWNGNGYPDKIQGEDIPLCTLYQVFFH